MADRLIVATDDERIEALARGSGAETHVSRAGFRCGSDRVADAVAGVAADVIINVQGDEPLVDEATLRAAVAALAGNDLGTVVSPLGGESDLADPNTVKVQVAEGGRASAFSRGALPGALGHHGIYAFTPASLQRFAALPSTASERRERLEQLRALEWGLAIGVGWIDRPLASVNSPEDIERVAALLLERGSSRLRRQGGSVRSALGPDN